MIVTILFITVTNSVRAATYYFSSSTGNDSYSSTQAQNSATPWKTISKFNASVNSFASGDVILFNRGDVFYGSLIPARSGLSFGAYGTGKKPVITGFTTISNWTNLGNNIYEAIVHSASPVNMVAISGVLTAMGRYPNLNEANKGWLSYESLSPSNSITDDQLTGSPNWAGGEAVIRKQRWVIDRCPIVNHTGTTLFYKQPLSSNYPGLINYGYFIQNHINTLDQNGEWFYDAAAQKIKIYYTSTPPVVEVATVDCLVNFSDTATYSDLSFDNIDFRGCNKEILRLNNNPYFTITNCDLSFGGEWGINFRNCPHAKVQYNNLSQINNSGINLEKSTACVIGHNTIKRTGLNPGGIMPGDGNGYAVRGDGDSNIIEYNIIVNNGYIGLSITGNNSVAHHNFIDSFCSVKDDGAGIYTAAFGDIEFGKGIYNNIIINGIGAGAGTDDPSYLPVIGIYLDDLSNGVSVSGNSVYNMPGKCLFLHNCYNITVEDNNLNLGAGGTRYPRVFGIGNSRKDVPAIGTAIRMSGNKYVAVKATDLVMDISSIQGLSGFAFDNNYYARPIDDNQTIYYNEFLTLRSWQSLDQDPNSQRSPLTVSSTNSIRFEYNATGSVKEIPLDKKYIDLDNNVYENSISLQPFTSVTLLYADPGSSRNLQPKTKKIIVAIIVVLVCLLIAAAVWMFRRRKKRRQRKKRMKRY